MSEINSSIFKTYDIRGIVGSELTENTAYLIGRSIATKMTSFKQENIACGRDIRLSSPAVSQALIRGLQEGGLSVTDIGVCTTPILYYACKVLDNLNSGVMVTASHNPAEYNGFKIVINDRVLTAEEIQALYQNCCTEDFSEGSGDTTKLEIIDRYIDDICTRVQLSKPLRIAIDYGNSTSALVAPRLFDRLGCEVIGLYEELDGSFPNHPPEPTQPKNLTALIELVKKENVDLAFAFDGDADRMIAIAANGDIVFPDRIMMLFAKDILHKHSASSIVYDIKCNHQLEKIIAAAGGKPILSATGHTIVKHAAIESAAVLAGEMSGHFIFYENWYGFDDGIYAAVRLLEILDQQKKTFTDLLQKLPIAYSSPELQMPVTEEDRDIILEKLLNCDFADAEINTLDGIRVEFNDGFGLMRASNTTPCFVFRFSADSQEKLNQIMDLFREKLLIINSKLSLPF